MIGVVLFILSVAWAQDEDLPTGKTKIDFCLNQKHNQTEGNFDCTECPSFFKLEKNEETNRVECKFLTNCIEEERVSEGEKTSSRCIKCKEGYRLNLATNECEPGTEYGYYVDGTFHCVEGTSYTPNGCRKCDNIPHCKVAHISCSECYRCVSGYYLKEGQCVKDEEQITTQTCEHNYNLDNNDNCNYQLVENCLYYDYINKDEGITDMFDASVNYKNAKCVECETGYILKQGECIETRGEFFNCKEVNKMETGCAKCKYGYGLVEGQCIKCDDPNCLNCDGNPRTCGECKSGYKGGCKFVQMGQDKNNNNIYEHKCTQCHTPIPNCQTESFGIRDDLSGNAISYVYQCSRCDEGFYLVDEHTCQQCSYESCDQFNIDDIKNLNGDNYCSDYCMKETGKDVVVPIKDKCVGDVTYFDVGKKVVDCKGCAPLYYLTADYTCAKCSDECKYGCAGTATNCIGGSLFTQIDNCLNYTLDFSKCAVCENGYEVSEDGMTCENVFEPEGMRCEVEERELCLLCLNLETSEYCSVHQWRAIPYG